MSAQIDFLWVLLGTIVIGAVTITFAAHIAISSKRELATRKQAEVELKKSEEKYRSLVESTDDAVYLIGRDMRYEFANSKYLSRLGLSLTELVGQEYGKIHPWNTSEEFVKKVDHVIKSGKPMTYEYLSLRDNKYFIRTLSPVTGEKPGEIKAITITSKDITERKWAEEALRESEARYRELVEKAGVAILIDDEQGCFTYFNDRFVELFGYSTGEMDKQSIEGLVHPDDIERVMQFHRNRLAGKQAPPHYEFKGIKKDGSVLWLEVDVVAQREDGRIVGSRSYIWDVTERKRAEDELRESRQQLRNLSAHLQTVREESQKLLAREIHDELGQDLTALKMDLSWLKGKLRQDQELLREKATDMTDLANTMIQAVKRISTQLRPALLDDLGVVAAIEWEMGEFEKRVGIECELIVEPEEIDLGPDRSTALYRIFQEALTNITRHAQASKVKATLRLGPEGLEMVVRDNGIGIAEEQINSPVSFGLVGIRERAMQFGGEVRIEGAKGVGTTISITLPIAKGELHHD